MFIINICQLWNRLKLAFDVLAYELFTIKLLGPLFGWQNWFCIALFCVCESKKFGIFALKSIEESGKWVAVWFWLFCRLLEKTIKIIGCEQWWSMGCWYVSSWVYFWGWSDEHCKAVLLGSWLWFCGNKMFLNRWNSWGFCCSEGRTTFFVGLLAQHSLHMCTEDFVIECFPQQHLTDFLLVAGNYSHFLEIEWGSNFGVDVLAINYLSQSLQWLLLNNRIWVALVIFSNLFLYVFHDKVDLVFEILIYFQSLVLRINAQ